MLASSIVKLSVSSVCVTDCAEVCSWLLLRNGAEMPWTVQIVMAE